MTQNQALSELPKGTRIQGYEIISVLGGGKTSLVYKAHDQLLSRPIALKEYLPAGSACRLPSGQVKVLPKKQEQFSQGLMRFVNEARCMSNFRHSVFREAIQLIQHNDTAYIVMPYYEGTTLRKMVRDNWRVKNIGELFAIILPILAGISLLHKASYCHCDISPNNVLVRENSPPILLDFGAVQHFGKARIDRPLTELAAGFAAKEQYEEESECAAWTDIYSLSALAYYIITGIIPDLSFSRIAHDPLKPLAHFSTPDLPSIVLDVFDIGLIVESQNRFQHVASFSKALENAVKMAVPISSESVTKSMLSIEATYSSLSPQQRDILHHTSELRRVLQHSNAN
jgi:serine/threonine protein kinase